MTNSISEWANFSHRFNVQRSVSTIIVLMLIAVLTLSAQQSGKISGEVRDAETGEPLIGCNVAILGTTLGASTDIDGSFFILNITPSKYDIQASMVGYQPVVLRGAVVNSGRTTTANFKLNSSALVQKEVVVEAIRPDVEKEKTSTSAIIRSEEVQALAGIRDVGDVLGLAADVTDGHFRGGRLGEEYYTLQGMGIVNPLNNTTAFLPIMGAVEEVEVITSGFGAQYGNAQSGVVNISMKEGKSDKWRTKFETRVRTPGRKHFGPSVFDPKENPYLAFLLDENVWLQGDPQTNTPYYGSMGSGLKDRYGGDTLVLLQIARTLWQNQTKRDLYRNYGNEIDYSVEAATGGPVDDNLKMFLALRSNVQHPVFPTEQPDIQRQFMGNIATELFRGASLRLSGGLSEQNTNVFPSSNSTGYLSWLWDRILSINYRKTTNLQLGAKFTHALSLSTFYELKLSSLWTKRKVGSSPAPSSVADSLIINDQNKQIDWDKVIPQVVGSPDGFYYLRGDDEFRDELTRTVSFDASITSQITKSHLLNSGIQFNTYLIDVSNALNTRRGAGGPIEIYKVKPIEAAFYAQDKMEFEGLIANIGLRWDFWSSQAEYFTNLYNPNGSKKEKAPTLGRLQPRVGVSFPISTSTVFHLNYGSFMQRASFQYVVSSRIQQGLSLPIRLGNPKLKPETTNSYDVGVMQGLGEGFTLDVSGYYKDVKNLVEMAQFQGITSYSTFFNRDYADIRGFRVALTKKRGELTGSINYQFSVATGKSATAENAPPSFILDTTGQILSVNLEKVPIRDIILNFDRTHNLIINLAYITNQEWGPQILGVYPFSDFSISASSFIRSGRPYTSPKNPKNLNTARTPAEYNTNTKLTRRIRNFFGTDATIYFEVFNIFNNKILNYDYLFSTPDASKPNKLIENYESYAIDDPNNGILYWPNTSPAQNWAANQSFLIYDNLPRSFNLGIIIEL